ncbi:hypothetical protein ACVWW1_008156 [Bradyrhizobium sp. JR3.5]
MPTKIGPVKAMAAIGMVENAKAPPASMPAQRQVITNCAPLDAFAKKATGTTPQAAPSASALRTSRYMVRRDTNCGLAMRRDARTCMPKNSAALLTAAAHTSAKAQSGDCHSATASTSALQALASMMPKE